MQLQTILLLSLMVLGCQSRTSRQQSPPSSPDFPYALETPDVYYRLPSDLEEVSGLTWVDENQIACLQDEKGVAFLYQLDEKRVKKEIPFAKDGDFEGIEWIEGDAYALRSDGVIFEIKQADWEADEWEASKFDTPLSEDQDTEGLGYWADEHALLIACKDEGGKDLSKYEKAIYSFDLNTHELSAEPRFVIRYQEIAAFMQAGGQTFEGRFKPSAIAIHPITGDLYVLASSGKMLLILNQAGEIQKAAPLTKDLFRQPEGICFAPNGDLYIANEADGGRAMMMKFRYE